MNTMRNDTRHLFDLLVDNELSDAERRELLAQCEAQPDGWRDCALAFLEAQDWSNTFGRARDAEEANRTTAEASLAAASLAAGRMQSPAVVQGAVDEGQVDQGAADQGIQPRMPASPVAKSSRPAVFWNLSSAAGGLAMAASLLLAFGLGLWMNSAALRGWLSPVNHDFVIGSGNGEQGASPNEIGQSHGNGLPQNARLVVGGSSGSNEVQVPIIEGEGIDEDWWRRQPAAMPDDVRRALERLGHHVRERRQLVPFDLDDGRRIMVPVDQVDVEPAEQQLYQ